MQQQSIKLPSVRVFRLVLLLQCFVSSSNATFHRTSLFAVPYPRNALPRAFLSSAKTTSPSVLLSLRGGSLEEQESDDDDFSDDDQDESLFGFEQDDDTMTESDFADDNTFDRILLAWKRTPPLTKAYVSASFSATLYGYLTNKNQFPKILLLDWNKILTKLQLWRLITSFFNFGPLGLGWFLTAHFVWTYMSTLERLHHNRPYDFWILILFGQVSMVLGYPVLGLSPGFLGHNLSTYFVYLWSRHYEGNQVSMFDLFTARAELLPWMFLAQTFLLEGELPVLDFLGIVFGHLYHHCKTIGILSAPKELVTWYQSETRLAVRIRNLYKPISSDFEMVM